MNLYLIQQNIRNGYDTYDSAVVAAKTKEEARTVHPSTFVTHHKDNLWYGTYRQGGEYKIENDGYNSWVAFKDVDKIEVQYLGKAAGKIKKGVVCASFNAG